jgi:hypothetical protein
LIMADRGFSVAAVVLGASVLMLSLAVTPAAAWTNHRHVRVYRYAPARHVTVHPVYRYGYPVAVYNYYGYRPSAVAGGVVDAAGAMAVGIVAAAAGPAGGILGSALRFLSGVRLLPCLVTRYLRATAGSSRTRFRRCLRVSSPTTA